MRSRTPAPPMQGDPAIPIFELYGYGNVWTVPDPLYCETIAAQRKLHHWHVLAHKHADLFQILLVEAGQVAATLDGRTRAFGPGWVLLVPRLVVHEFAFRPGTRGYIVSLTYALLYALCQRLGLGLCAADDWRALKLGAGAADAFTARAFARLDHEYRHFYGPQRGPLLEALLAVILTWASRRGDGTGPQGARAAPGGRHLGRYARLINDHYAEQHQVGWYARRLGLTPARLNATVRAAAGKSAQQLIHERLLLEARRELIYTTRAVGAIADALGFSDPGYFTRFFKRLAGISPKDFRAAARARGDGATATVAPEGR